MALLRGPSAGGRQGEEWQFSSAAVEQYEVAVQSFLERLMVLMHMGSGQPARRPEFLSIRWCNSQAAKRNIFLHDGYMMFVLNYHKSLNMTNASRYPVRFLLPEGGQLLAQFLLLIQPFRIWLNLETGIVGTSNEYLWYNRDALWTDDKMTKVLKSRSTEAVGVRLTVQAWRQIAVGIAIKKFSGQGYQYDLDLPADGHAGPELAGSAGGAGMAGADGSMAEVFHWQASHNPRTGNAVYGGTVNYKEGLTDAGLQEYLKASRMWHALCRHPAAALPSTPSLKHARRESGEDPESPLVKRLARRRGPQGCRRIWSMVEARGVLQQLLGPQAVFRGDQVEAIRAIISNKPEVVAVLATGGGKSLLYQLPARLPGAGTTILVVPLVALKLDTIQRCRQLGIDCTTWDGSSSVPGFGCPLVVVSVDQAVKKAFLSYANQLDVSGQLARVVLDECHLVCTASSYRKAMKDVKQLRALHCQFLFLTATLPPGAAGLLEESLVMTQPAYIRSLTVRRDLHYYVSRHRQAFSSPFDREAVDTIQSVLEQDLFTEAGPGSRALVFVRARSQADAMARMLDCEVLYSDSGTLEEKAAVLTQWMEGSKTVLVATSALAGLDYRHVRVVFHIGEPIGGAVDFAQDTGRAGRDGKGGYSIVILPSSWKAKYKRQGGEVQEEGGKVMQQFLDEPRCRMAVLSKFLDGEAQVCKEGQGVCDRCAKLGLLEEAPAEEEEDGGEGEEEVGGGVMSIGSEALARQAQRMEQQLQAYMQRLETLRGKCCICVTVGGKGMAGGDHTLDQCRNAYKFAFLTAKKTAVKEGKGRGGWLAKYGCCYGCGNLQRVCEGQGKGGGCRFKDMVMPLSWSAMHRPGLARVVLEGLAEGKAAVEEGDEGRYMQWLGEAADVFDEQGTNMVAVADRVMKEVLK